MIKVLVVDDSTIVRKIIVGILNKHPKIEVITASNGHEALTIIQEEQPDVVTLDVEMPLMNGLEALKIIMRDFPRPVIMLSALTGQGTLETVEALRLGAVDCIPKINSETVFLSYIETELIARILYFGEKENYALYAKRLQQEQQHPQAPYVQGKKFDNLILIGASTGGPLVLQHIFSSLSIHFTGTIVTALHMPKGFSLSFVERLQKLCALPVKIIEDSLPLEAKTIYICYGGYQTTIEQKENAYIFRVHEDTGEYPYKPSVDLLFSSVARLPQIPISTMALILTGMGHDGLMGCKELHAKGIPIYAQDEQSSVVFGMPKSVLNAGIATDLPLDSISKTIEDFRIL